MNVSCEAAMEAEVTRYIEFEVWGRAAVFEIQYEHDSGVEVELDVQALLAFEASLAFQAWAKAFSAVPGELGVVPAAVRIEKEGKFQSDNFVVDIHGGILEVDV